MYNTENHWVCGFCSTTGILNNYKTYVSETVILVRDRNSFIDKVANLGIQCAKLLLELSKSSLNGIQNYFGSISTAQL
jgi:hypothetical protein